MIGIEIMYTVCCGGCKAQAFEGEEITAWNTKTDAWEMARGSGWKKITGDHYCPSCHGHPGPALNCSPTGKPHRLALED